MWLLMINMTIGFVNQTGILRYSGLDISVVSDSPVDSYGNLLEKDTLAYKIHNFNKDREYASSATNFDQQYLRSGGDFVRGIFWFIETFVKGVFLLPVTLRNFGVPDNIIWYFSVPITFLYILAIIQMVSGRQFGGMY